MTVFNRKLLIHLKQKNRHCRQQSRLITREALDKVKPQPSSLLPLPFLSSFSLLPFLPFSSLFIPPPFHPFHPQIPAWGLENAVNSRSVV